MILTFDWAKTGGERLEFKLKIPLKSNYFLSALG
jgi:hypothetical protein